MGKRDTGLAAPKSANSISARPISRSKAGLMAAQLERSRSLLAWRHLPKRWRLENNATMTAARRLAKVETIEQRDSASNMLNKCARTFTAQVKLRR